MTIELISKGKLHYIGGQTIREQFSQLDVALSTATIDFSVDSSVVEVTLEADIQEVSFATVGQQEVVVEVTEVENINFDIEC